MNMRLSGLTWMLCREFIKSMNENLEETWITILNIEDSEIDTTRVIFIFLSKTSKIYLNVKLLMFIVSTFSILMDW